MDCAIEIYQAKIKIYSIKIVYNRSTLFDLYIVDDTGKQKQFKNGFVGLLYS